jgi:pimeloyl-ACP methyl ester carboxylesterase
MPFFYGRWDDAARAHAEVGVSERSRPVRDGFATAGAFHPAATCEAAGRLAALVLVYAGELDASPTPATAAAAAALYPDATVTVQPGAAHFPWLDDPAFFTTAIASFLS